MSDSQKYYYMRIKEDFFDSHEMKILESMKDGYMYSNILLKLYLCSLKDNGRLMFNERIPYSPEMIATITRHQVGTVEKALRIFIDMELIEVLDTGAIYMLNIQQFIGKSSTEADRKREYRNRIDDEKKALLKGETHARTNVGQMSDKHPPEIEIELELELELEQEKNICANAHHVFDKKEAFLKFWNEYPKKKDKKNAEKKFYGKCKNKKTFDEIMEGLRIQKKSVDWLKNKGQYIPHPTTWLNGERWRDEVKPVEEHGNVVGSGIDRYGNEIL